MSTQTIILLNFVRLKECFTYCILLASEHSIQNICQGRIAELEKRLSHVGLDMEAMVTTSKLLTTTAEDNRTTTPTKGGNSNTSASETEAEVLRDRVKELETKVLSREQRF
jgi:hypothetical protein